MSWRPVSAEALLGGNSSKREAGRGNGRDVRMAEVELRWRLPPGYGRSKATSSHLYEMLTVFVGKRLVHVCVKSNLFFRIILRTCTPHTVAETTTHGTGLCASNPFPWAH